MQNNGLTCQYFETDASKNHISEVQNHENALDFKIQETDAPA